MKLILESERHIGDNPFDFFSKNLIPNGSFVSIGYVNDKLISKTVPNDKIKRDFGWGPDTKKPITPKNDAELTAFINKIPDSKFRQALIDFQNSPKYQAALANGGKAPFNIEGDAHVVKIGRYIVNWKSADAFAKFYADRSDAIARLRHKYGFGNPEEDYPENDWRRKEQYRGTGIRPISKAKGKQGSAYKPLPGNTGFYSHIEIPGKLSIRQIGNPKASKESLWIFIDSDGKVSELNKELIAWIRFAYKSPRAIKEEISDIKEEEQNFLNELANIKDMNKNEVNLLLDNILYLTGTTVDSEGNKEPFTWLNDNKIAEMYPYIDRTTLDNIIKKCVKVSAREANEMNESFKVIVKKSINESIKNRRHGRLYEAIIKNSNKFIKKHLNEGFEGTNTRFNIGDLEEAIKYFDTYYEEFPDEVGEYPNWGELDDYFSNPDWCDALMNRDDDPLVAIVDKIYELFYKA